MGRLIQELKAEVASQNSGMSKPGKKPRKQIDLPRKGGHLISDFAKEIAPILKEENELFYRPAEKGIVKLEMLPSSPEQEKKIIGFQPLTPAQFVTHLEKTIIPGYFYINDKGFPCFDPKSITCELAKVLMASDQLQQNLPIIERIYTVPMPILKDGKLIFPKSGYDPVLKSWLPIDAPKINENMSIDEAKEVLNFVYKEFCFKGPQDQINAKAGLITPYCRDLYSRPTCRTPVYFYEANRERVGKDYCADITGITYYGDAADETPLSDGKVVHDDEFRKKILSTLRLGRNRIHSSNNKGHLNSSVLEAASTNEHYTDRVLGSNNTLTFPNMLEFSLSANTGITYTPDLANRSIFVRLFLDMEDPNARTFKNPDLHNWARNNRSNIISAIYALVKNWYQAGMPPGPTPFSSFPEWARVVGGIMTSAGIGDPCVSNAPLISIGGDSETKDMKRLFELCHERWKEDFVKKQDIMLALENEEFQDIFSWIDWSHKGSKNKFGILLSKYVGRVLSDIRLIQLDNSKSERRQYKFSKETETGGVGAFGAFIVTAQNINQDENNIPDSKLPQHHQNPHIKLPDPVLMPCSRCGTTEIPCKWEDTKGHLLCDVCNCLMQTDDE